MLLKYWLINISERNDNMPLTDKDIDLLDEVIAEDNALKTKVYGDVMPQHSKEEIEQMSRWFTEIRKSSQPLSVEELKKIM